jgi:hypothetical protein
VIALSNVLFISQFSATAWKVKNKIECVGACQTESPKCNSVFFSQQTLFCGLASLLGSYNTGITLVGNIAYVQVGMYINIFGYPLRKFYIQSKKWLLLKGDH